MVSQGTTGLAKAGKRQGQDQVRGANESIRGCAEQRSRQPGATV